MRMYAPRRCALLLAALLAGCASFSPDGGQDQVRQLAAARGQAIPAVAPASRQAHIDALLAAPLTADGAVDIALLNNNALQAGYAELGIAEAELVQAARIQNPAFTFGRLRGHDGVEIERQLMLPVIGLLTKPLARPLEQRRYELAQMRTAGEALRVADDTRRAWYAAVAAQQSADYMDQVKTAAEASAELARRMAQAGNWSRLQQTREQAFYADAVAQLARARHARTAEREKLTRLMGLWGQQAGFLLPERLPELPAQARTMPDAEGAAMANRLDILMAQKELAGLAASLGLNRATRFVNLLDLSYLRNQGPGGERASGYEIELQIPLFDWGGARVAKAEAMYMQAVQRAAGLAVDARSQVRESYSSYRTAYDLARHYRDEIVPLKKRISDEQLLRYNGMLISVFELLADAREQVASVNAAIDAQRDFWIADAALQGAMTGAGSAGAPALRASGAAAANAPQH
jgi:outer membrane protein TolC